VPVLVSLLDEELQSRGEVSLLLRLTCYGDLGVLRGMMLEGLQIQHVEDGLAIAFVPFVESGAGLVTEQVLLLHLLELLRRLELLARLILGDGLVEVLGHADGDVKPDLVVEPEGGRFRVADERACNGVDLFDPVAVLEGVARGLHPCEGSYPVADKVRGVLGDDATLAEHPFSEITDGLDDLWVRVLCGYDLHELQVSRRVEEVRAHEASLELLGESLGDAVQWYTRGIGRDDCVFFRRIFDALHELSLGFELLDYGLDDPIRFANASEVLFEVPDPDPVSHVLGHERGGPGVLHPVEAGLYDGVLIVIRGYVEQIHLQARIGAVGRDGGAHRASPEYGYLPDPVRHQASRSYP